MLNARILAVVVFASGLAALALGGTAAAAGPDLAIQVTAEPASGAGNLTATELAHAVFTLTNNGLEDAGAFEVDITASDRAGTILLGRHSVQVQGLAHGANLTVVDNATFTTAFSGDVHIIATADPAHRVNDTQLQDNIANRTVYFAPPAAQKTVETYQGKIAATRTLPPYAYLAFRIELRDGDSLIFQADSGEGEFFDCYLMQASAYERYRQVRESPDPNASVLFIKEYSRNATTHIQYTADPLPPGTYYLVIENDQRLQLGASPTGPVTVDYALAVVNNSLPPYAAIIVMGAAAAAIYATVRWRPHFDVRSPLLEVPPPEAEELDGGDPGADPFPDGASPLPDGETGMPEPEEPYDETEDGP